MTAKPKKGLKPAKKKVDDRGSGANAVLDRIREFYGLGKEAELARHLDVSTSLLANWRRRETLDYKRVIEHCTQCDLNWLFLGRSLEETADIVSPQTQLFLDTKRTLDQDQVKEMMFDAMKSILKEEGIEVREGKKDADEEGLGL